MTARPKKSVRPKTTKEPAADYLTIGGREKMLAQQAALAQETAENLPLIALEQFLNHRTWPDDKLATKVASDRLYALLERLPESDAARDVTNEFGAFWAIVEEEAFLAGFTMARAMLIGGAK